METVKRQMVFMAIRWQRPRLVQRLGFCGVLFLLLTATWGIVRPGPLRAQEADKAAKLTFTKVLKGSVPEYAAIAVDSSGAAVYEGRKLDESPNPRPLKLSPATTRRLFELAAQLNYFQATDLESHKEVANLGLKTLAYSSGGQENRAVFNYTLRREAQELADLFEKIAAVQQHKVALERAIKYDHLSLPSELLRIQADLEKKALADPETLVPTLEEIVRNRRFLHLAQVRAQNILERLQNSN